MKQTPGSRYSDRYRPHNALHDDGDIGMRAMEVFTVLAVGASLAVIVCLVLGIGPWR